MFRPLPWEGHRKGSEGEYLSTQTEKQAGVTFPSAAEQEYIMLIRLDLISGALDDAGIVRRGLQGLCGFFDQIDKQVVRMDEKARDGTISSSPLSKYGFTATLGFGKGFFDKLNIPSDRCPKRLFPMPDHYELGDPEPYTLRQTDLIIQLGSNKEYVNRWIFQNDTYHRILENGSYIENENHHSNVELADNLPPHIHDIKSAVKEWAIVSDTHSGFQRMDGRNLMGFIDGISNPNKSKNDIVWLREDDEGQLFKDGTYMAFQKIEHDLEKWGKMSVSEQEKWVGRSKATGLLLGTLSEEEDQKLANDCSSKDPQVRNRARTILKKLVEDQSDPNTEFFSGTNPKYENIKLQCPPSSHVRRSNPRGEDGLPKKIIFRRGYLFMSDGERDRVSSGILFICFQKNIREGFEYIKKNFLKNISTQVPERRTTTKDTGLSALGLPETNVPYLNLGSYRRVLEEETNPNFYSTRRGGPSGPSKPGLASQSEPLVRVLGGGYYFVPPVPARNFPAIAERFF
jgi:Dyp-type peroxidase family